MEPFVARAAQDPALVEAINIQVGALNDVSDRLKLNPDASLYEVVPDLPPEPAADAEALVYHRLDPVTLAEAAQVVRVLLAYSAETSNFLSAKTGNILTDGVFYTGDRKAKHMARRQLEAVARDQFPVVFDGQALKNARSVFQPLVADLNYELDKMPRHLQRAMEAVDVVAGRKAVRNDSGQRTGVEFNDSPLGRSIMALRSDSDFDSLFSRLMAEARSRVTANRDLSATRHPEAMLHPANLAPGVSSDEIPLPSKGLMSNEELKTYVMSHIDPEFPGMKRIIFEPGVYHPTYDAIMRDELNVHVVAIKGPSRQEVDRYYFKADNSGVPEWARFYPISVGLQYDIEARSVEEHLAILRQEDLESYKASLKPDETLENKPLRLFNGRSRSERGFLQSLERSAALKPFTIAGPMADIPDIARRYKELRDLHVKEMDAMEFGGRGIGAHLMPEDIVERLLKGEKVYGAKLKDWYTILFYDPAHPDDKNRERKLIGGYVARHWKEENIFGGAWAAYDVDAKSRYELGMRAFVICLDFVQEINSRAGKWDFRRLWRYSKNPFDFLRSIWKGELTYLPINWYSEGVNFNFSGGPEKPGLMNIKNMHRPKQVDPYGDFLLQKVLNPSTMFDNMHDGKRVGWILAVLKDVMVHRALDAQEADPKQSVHMWDMMMKDNPEKKLTYDQAIRYMHFAFDPRSTTQILFPPAFRHGGVEVVPVPKGPYLLKQAAEAKGRK